jgi:hypothetical protein
MAPGDFGPRMTAPRRIPSDSPLRDAPEEGIGLTVPAPLSDRINALVDLLDAAGERTNRKELIAALILAAPPTGDELAGTLRVYRRASVRDALVEPDRAGETVQLAPRKPGPRPRKRTKR